MEIIQVHSSSQNAQPDPNHVKPKRRRLTKEDGVLPVNKRVRIPPVCIPAIFHLKEELGFRSDGEIVQWLLHQLRPELVPSPNTKPTNSTWTRQPVKLPVPKPVCMDYLNDHQLTSYLPVPSAGAAATRQSIRATVVQASSVFFDTPATLDKAERLIAGAAAYGSQLVVFPEAFLGGYPRCPTFATATDDDLQKYYASAIDVPGPEVDRLAGVAGKYKVHLVMGVVERAGFYLFSTVLFFDSLGQHLGQHRKLMLMASEIAVWYSGEKSSLPVYETSIGKVGGLICWDNKSPLLRTELYAKGIEIYCAPSADAREIWKSTMIHIAVEGGCFVLSANQFCRRRDYPLNPGGSDSNVSLDETTCSGGSVIVSPLGTVLAGPNYQGECLISADLDLVEISRAKTEFGTVRSNLKPNHVGWTESGPNPILLATDMKAEVPSELLW